jgi:hypothetical protein
MSGLAHGVFVEYLLRKSYTINEIKLKRFSPMTTPSHPQKYHRPGHRTEIHQCQGPSSGSAT